jgi:hypothetical protein
MVHPSTLFHRRQRGIPMRSYENRSQIQALATMASPPKMATEVPEESAELLDLVVAALKGQPGVIQPPLSHGPRGAMACPRSARGGGRSVGEFHWIPFAYATASLWKDLLVLRFLPT